MSELFLMNELFGLPAFDKPSTLAHRGGHHQAQVRNEAYPHLAVDFYEHNNQYVVQADLPGFRKDDIDVHIENGVLSLQASRNTSKVYTDAPTTIETNEPTPASDQANANTKDEASAAPTYYRRERSSAKVVRAFRLPVNAAKDQAEVTYVDGVLTVTIPKEPNTGAKKLTIA